MGGAAPAGHYWLFGNQPRHLPFLEFIPTSSSYLGSALERAVAAGSPRSPQRSAVQFCGMSSAPSLPTNVPTQRSVHPSFRIQLKAPFLPDASRRPGHVPGLCCGCGCALPHSRHPTQSRRTAHARPLRAPCLTPASAVTPRVNTQTHRRRANSPLCTHQRRRRDKQWPPPASVSRAPLRGRKNGNSPGKRPRSQVRLRGRR